MTHPSTTQTRELVVPGRVERQAKRQKRSRRISLVVLIGLALTVGVAGKALAWTLAISGVGVCNERTGEYDLAWKLDNTSEPEAATVTGDLSATVPAYGHKIVTESVPGSTSGSVSRTILINWPSDQANLSRVGTIEGLNGDCKEKEQTPTPTTAPPVKEKPKPVFHGTATNKKRTPPAVHRREPNPDDSIPVQPTQPMGALPFTGPEHPLNMNDLQWASFLISLGMLACGSLFLVVATRRKGAKQR